MKENRQELHSIIDRLTDSQVIYLLTLVKKLFGS